MVPFYYVGCNGYKKIDIGRLKADLRLCRVHMPFFFYFFLSWAVNFYLNHFAGEAYVLMNLYDAIVLD